MTQPGHNQLMKIFNDPTFAWELLQWEIAIEMNESLSGQAIAKLLELYMKGVERMNSKVDIREAYFKNKVQSLMMKNNVVRTLNKPPMAKKQKPLEVSAKVEPKKPVQPKHQSASQKKVETQPSLPQPKPIVNTFALQQKRREIEMRLAYQAHESSRENLDNIYNQQIRKQETFTTKVKHILNDHEERLKERINRRKLRTSTYRSRPEDTSDTFPIEEETTASKKEREESLSPRQNEVRQKKQDTRRKRHHSMQNKVDHELTISEGVNKLRKSFYIQTTVKNEDDGQQPNQYELIQFQQVVPGINNQQSPRPA